MTNQVRGTETNVMCHTPTHPHTRTERPNQACVGICMPLCLCPALQVDLHWLQRWCQRVSGPGPDSGSLAMTVCRVLLTSGSSGSSGDAMAAELFELLGDQASVFEDISMLVENRWDRGRGGGGRVERVLRGGGAWRGKEVY